MGKIILVTGGARSGKSSYAESILKDNDNVIYIATAIAFDDEMKDRIKKHQNMRNKKWETVDAYRNLKEVIAAKSKNRDALFFDCVTIMVSNLMIIDRDVNWDIISQEKLNEIEGEVLREIDALMEAMKAFRGTSVLVTNELGMGIVPEYPLSRYYRDIAGRVNQRIAAAADEVTLVVSGIPLKIKGEQTP